MAAFNFQRKIIHAAGVLIPLTIYFDLFDFFLPPIFEDNTRSISFILLFLFTLTLALIEFLRLRYSSVQHYYLRFLENILKPEERHEVAAALPYFASLTLVIAVFPRDLAALSMIFLTLGDPTAAYFGSYYGNMRFRGKSLEGFIAGVTISLMAGILLSFFHIDSSSLHEAILPSGFPDSFYVIGAGAVTAFLAELFTRGRFLDDNILVPLSGVIVMTWLSAWFSGVPVHELLYPPQKLLYISMH